MLINSIFFSYDPFYRDAGKGSTISVLLFGSYVVPFLSASSCLKLLKKSILRGDEEREALKLSNIRPN